MMSNPAPIRNLLRIRKEARRVEKKPIKVMRFGWTRSPSIFLNS